jgi:hypothetical protein
MPSTHVCQYFHIVFSAKDRHRWIKDSWDERLYSVAWQNSQTIIASGLDTIKSHTVTFEIKGNFFSKLIRRGRSFFLFNIDPHGVLSAQS